jgi:hypothetical protein
MLSGQRAMKSSEWITYRTRFLVKAKQLSSSLSFVDSLGRQHSGRKGDYLVESSDGVITITPRQIFEDVYVPMLADAENQIANTVMRSCEAACRKLPQPCRDRRAGSVRLGLMS